MVAFAIPTLVVSLSLMAAGAATPAGAESALAQRLSNSVLQKAPAGTRLLSMDVSLSPRGNAHIACGLADMGGVVEPYTAFAKLSRSEADEDVTVIVPEHDRDQDGEIVRYERGFDALNRRLILLTCKDLRPPDGVTWITEPEPHPDPAKEARSKAMAETIVNAIFGAAQTAAPASPSSPPPTP